MRLLRVVVRSATEVVLLEKLGVNKVFHLPPARRSQSPTIPPPYGRNSRRLAMQSFHSTSKKELASFSIPVHESSLIRYTPLGRKLRFVFLAHRWRRFLWFAQILALWLRRAPLRSGSSRTS
jgi:hypothetical protein